MTKLSMNWVETRLEEAGVEIIDGDRGKNYPGQDEFQEDGYCLFLNASNVTKNGFVFSQRQFINAEKDSLLRKGRLEKDDIILTTRGTVGNIAHFDNSVPYKVMRTNSGMLILRNRDRRIHTPFLYSVFRSELIQRQIKRVSFGSAQPQLTVGTVKGLLILLPPLPEQRKIAQILGMWDEAIATTEKLIAALERRKQGLMQRLLTGQVRFGEFAGSEWKKRQLGDILDSRSETSEQTDELELFSLTIENGVTPKTDRYDRGFLVRSDNKQYKKVYSKDIVYNPSNLRWGAIALSLIDRTVLVSPIYEVLTISDANQVSPEYLGYLLSSRRQIALFSQYAEGTLIERQAVKLRDFILFTVNLPSLEEQEAIAGILEVCDSEIQTAKQATVALKAQKKGLMQRLLTGQVRVRIENKKGV
jgi:type I restriction enzyme, S subunit